MATLRRRRRSGVSDHQPNPNLLSPHEDEDEGEGVELSNPLTNRENGNPNEPTQSTFNASERATSSPLLSATDQLRLSAGRRRTGNRKQIKDDGECEDLNGDGSHSADGSKGNHAFSSSIPNGRPLSPSTNSVDSFTHPTCSICLDQCHDIATLDCCSHRFCFKCIYQWSSEISSTCPLCKFEIHSLTHMPGEVDKDNDDDEDDEDDDEVQIISPKHVHANSSTDSRTPVTVIIPPKLQRATWEAEEFEQLPESIRNARCALCLRDDREDQLLLCDACDQAWHTDCVGLNEVPAGDFFCPECMAERESVAEEDDEPHSEDDQPSRTTRRRLRRARDDTRTKSRQRRTAAVAAAAAPPPPPAASRSSSREHLCRRRSSLSSLPLSSAGEAFAANMAARLAGWSGPSSTTSSAAQAARRRKSEAVQNVSTNHNSGSSTSGELSSSWSARQALSELASQREKFFTNRRQVRQRQHAANSASSSSSSANANSIISDWRRMAPQTMMTPAQFLTRNNVTTAAPPSLSTEPLRRQAPLTTPFTAMPSSSASFASKPPINRVSSSGPSVPIRRRIPKRTEPIEMKMDTPLSSNIGSIGRLNMAAIGAHSSQIQPSPVKQSPFTAPLPPSVLSTSNTFSSISTPSASSLATLNRPRPVVIPPSRPTHTHGPSPSPSSLQRISSPITIPSPTGASSPVIPSSTMSSWASMKSHPPSSSLARVSSPILSNRPTTSSTNPNSLPTSATSSPVPGPAPAPISAPAVSTSPLFRPASSPTDLALPPMVTFVDFDHMLPMSDAEMSDSSRRSRDGHHSVKDKKYRHSHSHNSHAHSRSHSHHRRHSDRDMKHREQHRVDGHRKHRMELSSNEEREMKRRKQ